MVGMVRTAQAQSAVGQYEPLALLTSQQQHEQRLLMLRCLLCVLYQLANLLIVAVVKH